MGFQDGLFKSQLVEHIRCLIDPFYARDHLCYILAGLLGIKMALPDYKDCIWVTLRSRGSVEYQDGPSWLQELHLSHIAISQVHWVSRQPFRLEIAKSLHCFSVKLHQVARHPFELRIVFEDTRDCHVLDFLWVLYFESRLCFKHFNEFYSFQNQVLPSSISPLSFYTNHGGILWFCAYFFDPHKPNTNSLGVLIIYLKALAHRFVYSIITEGLDESFLCGIIFRPTYAASTSASSQHIPMPPSITCAYHPKLDGKLIYVDINFATCRADLWWEWWGHSTWHAATTLWLW